jgi:hypothetical protein
VTHRQGFSGSKIAIPLGSFPTGSITLADPDQRGRTSLILPMSMSMRCVTTIQ